MLKTINKKLAFIFVFALALRLAGINHGFPYIFHPDESTIIQSALAIRFDINPGHFDWPHLYIYLNYLLYMFFATLRDLITVAGYKESLFYFAPIIWDDTLIFYLLTRALTALLGALTVIPMYMSAKNLFNERVGLFAALAMAVTPFHVWHSHYALSDVPMLFFVSWVLYFSTRILFHNDQRAYILGGLFVGLAATTKYNGALSAIFILMAHLIRLITEKHVRFLNIKSWENLIASGLVSIFGFILGTPFSVLDFGTFSRTDGPKGALWQFTNVGSITFIMQIQKFFTATWVKLGDDFGYTFIVLFLMSLLYVLYYVIRRKSVFDHKDLLLMLITGLVLMFYFSGFEKARSHYFFVVYPCILLGAVGFISKIIERRKIIVKKLLLFGVFAPPVYFSLINSFTFYQADTRLMLEHWLLDNGRTALIYYDGDDLIPVFKEKKPDAKKVDYNNFVVPRGCLLILSDKVSADYKLIKGFNNELRRGPEINIYNVN